MQLHFNIKQNITSEDDLSDNEELYEIESLDLPNEPNKIIITENNILNEKLKEVNLQERKSSRKRNLNKYFKAIKIEKQKNETILIENNNDSFNSCDDMPNLKSKETMICKLCDESVPCRLIEYHLNEHNRIYPFECDNCDKKFSSPIALKQHKYSVHPINKLQCKLCGVSVKHSSNLLRHHKTVHLKLYLQHCNICNLEFTTIEAFKRHNMIHDKYKPFECSLCSAKFRTKFNLKIHHRIHTQIKSYKCEICDAKFKCNQTLKKHVQRHMNNVGFE